MTCTSYCSGPFPAPLGKQGCHSNWREKNINLFCWSVRTLVFVSLIHKHRQRRITMFWLQIPPYTNAWIWLKTRQFIFAAVVSVQLSHFLFHGRLVCHSSTYIRLLPKNKKGRHTVLNINENFPSIKKQICQLVILRWLGKVSVCVHVVIFSLSFLFYTKKILNKSNKANMLTEQDHYCVLLVIPPWFTNAFCVWI